MSGPAVESNAEKASSVHVGYFTMEYPRATDTFIRREVEGVRATGVEVSTFAVRRPGDDEIVSDEQRRVRDETTYVFPPSPAKLLGAQVRLLTSDPKRWFRAARLARSTARAGVKGHLYQLFYFLEAGVVADDLIERDIDHLHAHFGDVATSVAMLAGALAGRPYSFTLHGPGVFFDANVWELGTKVEQSAFVSCISWFARSQAQLLSSEEAASKLHIVHCGVDPSHYGSPSTGDDSDRSSDDQPLRLAFVARLDHVKGLTILIDALAATRAAGHDVRLTVAGDGPKRSHFERHAKRAGVAEAVTFTGYLGQDGVAEVLAAADAFVLPSFAEGVPVSLMEACASGLPVVATQVGGVSELVVDGETGFIVPPGDVVALADRIVELSSDPSLRERLGTAGRQRVIDHFDSTVEARRLASLFIASSRIGVGGAMPTTETRPAPMLESGLGHNDQATPAAEAS